VYMYCVMFTQLYLLMSSFIGFMYDMNYRSLSIVRIEIFVIFA
jgi:hypothetical protein